jgi:hypothetical protein
LRQRDHDSEEREADLGRSDKGVGGIVAVVTASEVAVVGGDDRILLALLHVLARPLSDARAARVGERRASDLNTVTVTDSNTDTETETVTATDTNMVTVTDTATFTDNTQKQKQTQT